MSNNRSFEKNENINIYALEHLIKLLIIFLPSDIFSLKTFFFQISFFEKKFILFKSFNNFEPKVFTSVKVY